MTKQNGNGAKQPGMGDPKRTTTQPAGSRESGSQGSPPARTTPAKSSSNVASSSVKSGCADSTPCEPKSQEPGRGDGAKSGDCCDPKPSSPDVGDPSQSHPRGASPVHPEGRVGSLPTPSQRLGTREVKGDENRASQQADRASGPSRDTDRDASAVTHGEGGSAPARTRDDDRRRDPVNPDGPGLPGRSDPVQPGRALPTQPSRVQPPTIGSAGDDA